MESFEVPCMETSSLEKSQDVAEELEEKVPIERIFARNILSDVGTYSLAALTSVLLGELYPSDINNDFKTNFIKSWVAHLGLPDKVAKSMEGFLNVDGPDCLDSLISVIFEEKSLNGDGRLLIEDLVYFSIKDGRYDARSGVLVHNISAFLRVSPADIEGFEEEVLELLSQEAHVPLEDEDRARQERNRKIKRRIIIAAAAIGGGTLIGLSGGLAVPLLAAGAGAIIGGAGAAAIGSIAGVAIMGSLFGVAGAGLTGYKMKKRIGDVEEFAFEDLTDGCSLHVTIAVTGWLPNDSPGCFRESWDSLHFSKEQYCLRYESKYLLELGRAITKIATTALSMAAVQALQTTMLAGLFAAIAWPATLIQLSGLIDNPWCVCIRRSVQIGKILADTLISRQHGQRPVSLIGYSLGARVIFYCLQDMANRKGSEGIIEDVILLGAPVPANPEEWKAFNTVVNGRIVNGYCQSDWLLKFLFRTTNATFTIAGLQAVAWKDHRMHNVDLTDVVTGHLDYSSKIADILKILGIRTRVGVWKQSCMIKRSRSALPSHRSASRADSNAPKVKSSKSLPVLTENPTSTFYADWNSEEQSQQSPSEPETLSSEKPTSTFYQ